MIRSLSIGTVLFFSALQSQQANAQLYQSAMPGINSYNTSMMIQADTRAAAMQAQSVQNMNAMNSFNNVINSGGSGVDAMAARNAANAAGSQQVQAIQAAGQASQLAYDNAQRDALAAENQRRAQAAIITSNLSSARLGSTANMKGMGIFSSGGTSYATAIANQAAGLPPTYSALLSMSGFGAFSNMGMGTFGGGFGNGISGGIGGGYLSLGYNAFRGANVGTFNMWGGSAVTTMTPPQISFANFGIPSDSVSPVSLYGASSVSPFSVGTASAGPVTTIGAAAFNPWATQQARLMAGADSVMASPGANLGATRGAPTMVLRGNAISGGIAYVPGPQQPAQTGKEIALIKADGTQDMIFANNDELHTTIQNNINAGAYPGGVKPKPQLQRAWGL